MLRSSSNVLAWASNAYNVSAAPVCVQCVRWRRKPRWLPIAKSKMFRIPERTVTPIVEKIELLRLHANYKTQVRAIRKFLHDEAENESRASAENAVHMTPEEEETDFVASMRANEIWNAEAAKLRVLRLERTSAERHDKILGQVAQFESEKQENMEKAAQLVKLELEKSKSFITRATLDAAIEQCIANPVDYNFAIDLNGTMISGREGAPIAVKKDDKLKASN